MSSILFSVKLTDAADDVPIAHTTRLMALSELINWKANQALSNTAWEATQVNVKNPKVFTRVLVDTHKEQIAKDLELSARIAWAFAYLVFQCVFIFL